jgi:hypothetical protein
MLGENGNPLWPLRQTEAIHRSLLFMKRASGADRTVAYAACSLRRLQGAHLTLPGFKSSLPGPCCVRRRRGTVVEYAARGALTLPVSRAMSVPAEPASAALCPRSAARDARSVPWPTEGNRRDACVQVEPRWWRWCGHRRRGEGRHRYFESHHGRPEAEVAIKSRGCE